MKKLLYAIFLLFILLFCAPALQQKLKVIDAKPLNGSFIGKPKAVFSVESWFNGTYQTQQEAWINDATGFRGNLIRLYNEIDYRCFNATHAKDVVIGKNKVLFEQRYLDAYWGNDKIEDAYISEKVQKTKFIKDTLEALGIKLLIVLAPSKADYYHTFLPDTPSQISETRNTNYQAFIEQFQQFNIDYIDFNSYFVKQKDTCKYPLFTKSGIHWSDYGASLVADSLIHKAEHLLQIDMPNLICNKIIETEIPSNIDYDLGNLLNIFTPINQGNLGYPAVDFETDSIKSKPKTIVIGDSFFWNLNNTGVFNKAFNCTDFWYYFSSSYAIQNKPIDKSITQHTIENQNLVILLATVAGIQDFDFGFTNQLATIYSSANNFRSAEMKIKINQVINAIKNDPKWLKSIEEKAIENGITTDDMLQLDAEYMIMQQN